MNLTMVGRSLPAQVVEQAAALLGRPPDETGPSRVRWHAVEPTVQLRTAVSELCWPAEVDFAWLPAGARLADYAVLAMDMDSTLITIECIDEIADCAGLRAEVSAITEAAMRGEITDFADSLRRRVALLEGLDERVLDEVYSHRLRLSAGAEALLSAARLAGLKTLLVSGGFTFFTERLRARLGLDFSRANLLEVSDGRLTGRVLGEIVDARVKAQQLVDTCEQLRVPPARAIAIGDGANDLAMMREAGLSVAFHAKPIVRASATAAIQAGGLDTLVRWLD